MYYEEARAYLKRYEQKKQKIANLKAQIKRAEEDTRSGGVKIDGLPRAGKINHPTEDAALKLAQIRERLNRKIDRYEAECLEIEETVSMIPDARSEKLLSLKYLDGKKWDKVAEELYYSEAYVRRELHNRALELLEITMKRREII